MAQLPNPSDRHDETLAANRLAPTAPGRHACQPACLGEPAREAPPLISGTLARLSENAAVAVIRLRSLGDTVLTTPALALLKQARPDLRLVVVMEKPFDELLEGNPDVARVLAIERPAGFRSRLHLVRALRAERPELCLNLHGGSTSAWLTAFSGARFRAGYAHYRRSFPYNIRIPRAQQVLGRGEHDPVHTAEHHASAVFHLGAPRASVPRAALAARPERRGTPYAVLHVTAAYHTKQWPASRFCQAGRFLRDDCGLEPVMIAGSGEGAALDELQEFVGFDDLSIARLKSLLAGAELFVGNDSGPAHVAAAFGVPCVVIFGSSDSAVWRPWQTPYRVVETPWDCKPCPGDRCYAFEQPHCILSVEVSAVEEAIRELLAECREPSVDRPGAART